MLFRSELSISDISPSGRFSVAGVDYPYERRQFEVGGEAVTQLIVDLGQQGIMVVQMPGRDFDLQRIIALF